MARSSTTWKTGQSGNPSGRPASPLKALKARPVGIALLTLISELTNDSEHGELIETPENPARAERIANTLLEAMETGVVELRGGKQMDMTVKEWLQLTKWTLKHMEGNLRAIRPDQEIIEPRPDRPDPEPYAQDDDMPSYQNPDATMDDQPNYYEDVPLNTYVDPLKQKYLEWHQQEWERAQAEGRDDVPPVKWGDINWQMWDRWGEVLKLERAAKAEQTTAPTAVDDQQNQGRQTQSASTVPDSPETIASPPIPVAVVTSATPGIRILRRGGGAAAEMETHLKRLDAYFYP